MTTKLIATHHIPDTSASIYITKTTNEEGVYFGVERQRGTVHVDGLRRFAFNRLSGTTYTEEAALELANLWWKDAISRRNIAREG